MATGQTSLVVQWLGICLPKQGTQVLYVGREDSHPSGQLSPCAATSKPGCCNCWSPCAQSLCPNKRHHGDAYGQGPPCYKEREPATWQGPSRPETNKYSYIRKSPQVGFQPTAGQWLRLRVPVQGAQGRSRVRAQSHMTQLKTPRVATKIGRGETFKNIRGVVALSVSNYMWIPGTINGELKQTPDIIFQRKVWTSVKFIFNWQVYLSCFLVFLHTHFTLHLSL